MESPLLMPSPATDFNFDSTHTSPYATAPSSPKLFFPSNFNTAPDEIHEQKNEDGEEDVTDFAFDFSGQLEPPSISAADELFDGGKIKTVDPTPLPRSPTLSPRSYKKKNSKPFSEAFRRTPGDQTQNSSLRGRERTTTTTTTTRHKVSRSLSPMRVSDVLSDNQKLSTNQSSPFGFIWCNKWNIKNLLLFRSTSEGSAMITKGDQDVKNSSFRSSDERGSVGGSSRKMKRKVSAHEIHYTANRAVAEKMRKKTFLPYKSGLLSCLGFGHNLHEISSRGR